MKKIIIFLIVAMSFSLATKAQTDVWDGTAVAWTQGDGTQANPYLIQSAENLAYLANLVNNGTSVAGDYYRLMVDIDLNGSQTFQWTPIGNATNHFAGNFDGNNHTISNLFINTSILQYTGLFGTASNARIENVGITGQSSITNTTNNSSSGGIVGYNNNGTLTITNCYNTGNISSTSSGGIIGYISFYANAASSSITTTITNCYNTGNISSPSSSSGGIIGLVYGYNSYQSITTIIITNCYNTGNISSPSSSGEIIGSGGIIGCISSNSSSITTIITNCYNIGNIFSSPSGGIIGFVFGYNSYQSTTTTIITNCYNTGNISSPSYSGGIVGRMYNGTLTITNCYNIGSLSGGTRGGISNGGTVNNSYYLNTCGGNIALGTSMVGTAMQASAFATTLNNGETAFLQDISPYVNQGYPILDSLKYLYVKTLSSNNISNTKATLKGIAAARNTNITGGGFEYRSVEDSSYTIVNAISGNDTITATITGLIPNRQYLFRSYSIANGVAKIYGDTIRFTTLPVVATTISATSVMQTSAILDGRINSGDANISYQGFKIWNNAFDTIINLSVADSVLNYTLRGLIPNQLYRFKTFVTYNGITLYGDSLSFTTLPVVATTLPATSITRNSVVLNGKVSFGDANISYQGFRVWNNSFDTIINLSTTDSILNYTLNGLLRGTAYNYKTFSTYNNTTVYGIQRTFTTAAWNTNGNQYLIEDSADLILLAQLVADSNTFQGKSFLLVNDINLSIVPNNIRSIGSYPNRPFCGTFDGNGKLIYNVYIDKPNTEYQGFFGYTKNAYLYNVGLINITASGRNYTGGMVAYAENTDIRSSYVSGGTLFALSYVGGLVGYQTPGTNSIISGCYNTCQVSGNNNVGGLLGYSNNGTVRNSYVAGVVSGQGTGVGAIIGKADNVLSYNCYFSDSITGQTVAIGVNNFSKSGEGNMSNSEMQTQSFVNMLNQGLATSVWRMDYTNHINNGFPILIWQSGTNGICGVNKENFLALKLYPNPANSRTNLYVNGLKNNADIIIYDINGREVKRLKINKSEKDIDIDLNGLAKGIYQVRVIDNSISTTKKLIVR